jgi:hypothetical protein
MKVSYAGVALLAALVWVSPIQLRADTTTRQKTRTTLQKKSRRTTQHGTQKATATASQHGSTHQSSKRHVRSKAALAAAARRRRAQLRPEPERVQEIQQALVKTGYLNAEPNGRWDDQTRGAMRRYQADNGFPVTGLPEAKSLMKLGLGPHPLPPELDTSNGAKAGATTNGSAPPTPATPDAQQNPPTTTTPP